MPSEQSDTDVDRGKPEREDMFDRAVMKEDSYSEQMNGWGDKPPEYYAPKAAYYQGILNTFEWLRGDLSDEELLDDSNPDRYTPGDDGE